MENKFTFENTFKFGWEGLEGFAYNSKEDFANASTAIFNVSKKHGRCKSLVSDRVYYVLEGTGEFIIEDKKISVKATDVIIVPKNTEYDYMGTMKLFLVHTPAFDPSQEVDFEGLQS